MKTLKLILLALLMMAGLAANAQTIQIYKDGVVVKEYDAAAVDSVIYKPAEAQPRYYYYAGWECPTNETELASFLSTKGTLIGSSTSGFKYNFAESGKGLTYTSKAIFYIILPEGMSIYDNLGTDVSADQFTKQNMTANGVKYNVFTSVEGSRNINYLNIK